MKEDLEVSVEDDQSSISETQTVDDTAPEKPAKAIRVWAGKVYKITAKMEKKADRGYYRAVHQLNSTGYVLARPLYRAKGKALRLSSWNPLRLIGNSLRKRGIITEGYDIDRDMYVRRINVGNVSLDYVLHRFESGHYKVPSNPIAKIPPRYKLARPGMSPLYFGNLADLFERMHEVFFKPGFENYPEAPFILQDQHKKRYAILSPERLALRLQDKRIPFPG